MASPRVRAGTESIASLENATKSLRFPLSRLIYMLARLDQMSANSVVAILGTSADLGCDLNLLLQLGIFGILAVGFMFGHEKKAGNLRKHWSTMAAASILNLLGFVFVMAPSIWSFLAHPPIQLRSIWAVTSVPHAALGIFDGMLVISLGGLFFTNRSPRNMKTWMRLMFTLWIANIGLGVSLYLQMAGLF